MKALVVVDMQKDFIDGSLGTNEAVEIVPKVKDLIKEVQELGYDVFFTRDTHYEDYLSTPEGNKLPIIHCTYDTEGWYIDSSLLNSVRNPIIIDKPTFGSLELMEYLVDYEEVVFCGLCTDICVISNALMAKSMYPNTKVKVFEQCCAGVSPEKHNAAIEVMASCQVDIV